MGRVLAIVAAFLLADSVRAKVPLDVLREAIQKGLRRIEQGATSYTKNRQCFSCHHQGMSILTLSTAEQRHFNVNHETLRQQVDFTVATYSSKKDQLCKGRGVPGGNTMAAYSLMAFEAAHYPPDQITAALLEYLLVRQKTDGSWPALTQRPPSEGSTFTNNALALHALHAYQPSFSPEVKPSSVEKAIKRGEAWLLHNQPITTEDKVFRLRGLIEIHADKKVLVAACNQLLKEQATNGSWAQLASLDGDAYATGSVLATLAAASIAPTSSAYQQGIRYLLGGQKPDGSWFVETRSRPVQTFFDNGDPGGKSQFASFTSTCWAVLALLQCFPES